MEMADVVEFFINHAISDNLGIIANSHLALADHSPKVHALTYLTVLYTLYMQSERYFQHAAQEQRSCVPNMLGDFIPIQGRREPMMAIAGYLPI